VPLFRMRLPEMWRWLWRTCVWNSVSEGT